MARSHSRCHCPQVNGRWVRTFLRGKRGSTSFIYLCERRLQAKEKKKKNLSFGEPAEMAQHSRVPKFGDWENEKTIHDFSKAREDKIGGKPINPNDPQQNPGVKAGVKSSGVASPSWARKPSESNDKVPPRTPERSRMRPVKFQPEKVAAVPKFGEWDEDDPDSATGYTAIFNKVREEKWGGEENVMSMPSSPHGLKQAGSKRRRILRAFDSLRRIRIRKSGGGMSKPNDPDMSSSSYYDDNASIRSEWDEGNPYGESTSGNIIHSDTVWREDGLENKSCSSESPDQPGIVNNKKRRWLSWWWRKK